MHPDSDDTAPAREMPLTDRYQELGIPYPDPETMCKGQCEGVGLVPIGRSEKEEPWYTLWLEAEKKCPTDDGWHFVCCPDCGGTGKRTPLPKGL